jgi:hypothetical protein
LLAVSLMSLALGLAACADVTFWTASLYFGSLMALTGAALWFFIDPTRKLNSTSVSGE